jgi:NADPH-dependent 7-cyano-7-deazaguanine reductase QueF
MTNAQPVDCAADVTMTVTAPVRHLCPFVNEVDEGFITITWRVDGATLELHSLADYLREFKDSELSHEAFTDRVSHDLSLIAGVDLVTVQTTWTTAGMEVKCSTSPTLVGQP